MKKNIILVLVYFVIVNSVSSLPQNIVKIKISSDNGTVITVDSQAHIDYGFAYPLTYEFSLSDDISQFNVLKKYSISDNWDTLGIKSLDEFYNGIETCRIDNNNSKLFVSVGFSNETDTIFIKIIDGVGNLIDPTFNKITKYYDNRDAAVTSSADDMASWSQSKFEATITNFLQYNLYITLGMNTNGMSKETYDFVQRKINTGFVEAGAHSRTHPFGGAYVDYESEVTGCKEDIINNLEMPALYRNGDNEYVYTWIAPDGYDDYIIDSLVGQNKILVNRLYSSNFFDGFSVWNDEYGAFAPFTVTRAIDPPRERLGWGIGTDDIIDLNNKFDEVVAKGSVYHFMCHPNVVEWDKGYTWEHLEHISNKKNIWYGSLGHLYVYHLAQQNYVYENPVNVASIKNIPSKIKLYQNYPNPFNPSTTIDYLIPKSDNNLNAMVVLKIYNMLGQEIKTLVNEFQHEGKYSIKFNSNNLNAGIYLMSLQVNSVRISRKMIYLK